VEPRKFWEIFDKKGKFLFSIIYGNDMKHWKDRGYIVEERQDPPIPARRSKDRKID